MLCISSKEHVDPEYVTNAERGLLIRADDPSQYTRFLTYKAFTLKSNTQISSQFTMLKSVTLHFLFQLLLPAWISNFLDTFFPF